MPKMFSLILAVAAALTVADAAAQEQTPSVPPEQNAATGTPSATTSTAALFPEGGDASAASPAPANQAGGRRRNGAGGGRGRHGSVHATDAAIQQADQDPLAVRVAFRQAKTEAMVRDPGLADVLVQADHSPTDEVKRSYLRVYYTRLYTLIRKIDPSPEMKAHVALLAQAAEQRYDPKRRALSDADDLTNGRNGRGGGGKHRR